MKLLLALGLLISTQAFAKEFQCDGFFNYEQVFSVDVTLNEGQRNVSFAESEQFQFFLSNKSGNVIELQILDHLEPSRTYATANLDVNSFVELAIWKRDFLLETKCTLIK